MSPVCARSYAYTQLVNNYYSQYGAHVDDSVTFQVYNNTERNEAADTAVEETRGKAVYYNDEIVKTYYYSTSCGYSTDVCAWGSDDNSYPMYGSVHVGSGSSASDMTDKLHLKSIYQSPTVMIMTVNMRCTAGI